jgi:drug/metabolite transporter (DMT)-like permease
MTGLVAALVAIAIWAGWIPVLRLGVTGHVRPEDVAAVRYGIAGILLAPVLVLHFREVPWRRPWLLLVLMAGAGVPYQFLFGTGVKVASSGQAAVLGPGVVSALTALAAVLVLGERLKRAQLAGLAVTLAGVAVVLLHGAARAQLPGLLMIVAASALWALYTTASRALALRPLLNAALVACGNALLYLPAFVANGGAAHLAAIPPAELWLQSIYQGVLAAVVALVAFVIAVERLGATAASSFTPLTPVLATLIGWLLLGDRVDAATALGLAAVAAGVLIANRATLAALIARR